YWPQGHKLPLPYEGRPFVYGVLDCLSLVTDYYQNEIGITLNDGERKAWGWWLDAGNQHALVNGLINQGFVPVDKPAIDDVIVMQIGGGPCPNHLALYQGNGRILHHPHVGARSGQELYGFYWRQNTVKALRHSQLLELDFLRAA
ncbi:MAG: hypothetical protein C0509_08740, partial [Acinetobacter sp.]|nr:hypothetical protein [Acinetobacter sp.]